MQVYENREVERHRIRHADGREYELRQNDVGAFVREHGLHDSNFRRVLSGVRQHCGGWFSADFDYEREYDDDYRAPWGRNRFCSECRQFGTHHPNCPEA